MATDAKAGLEKAGLFKRDGGRVPLKGVDVTGELLGGHARVRVRQRYRNDEAQPVEALYVFPLPSDGTLTAFSMTCEGRRVEGVLKEREAAFRAYDDAVTAGHGAALLDQERPNVFTAQVGNLLPGEETLVEVEFLQAVQAEEGCVRWTLPTLVAPRYIPGKEQGERTAHGVAHPTDRVPDADRISPPVGEARYGLTLELLVDLGHEVVVESPSHALVLTPSGGGVRVGLQQAHVALDRDLVLTLRSPDLSVPLSTLVAHRQGQGPGTFALTVVPDLLELAAPARRQEIMFLVDISGSMGGSSLPQAQGALRLCLRHLREGDAFNVLAFDHTFRTCFPRAVPFTQKTLEEADRWVAALRAEGGTELLEPLLAATRAMPDGVLVLLTDGEVGNESEILAAVLAERKTARVYSFGIGTNVSDVLLKDLARQTGGSVEFIHPGERIDDKVVAQFAKALAPRVTELQAQFEGVEASELAPAELPPLVDGVPWTLLGRYEAPGRGRLVLRGRAGQEPFALSVPLALPDASERPAVEKLWAAERIRGWELASLVGRRAQAMKDRILELALAHGLVTKYTSFVVVEQRTGDRRASGLPETRVVPVNAPAGWAMFDSGAEGASGGPGGGLHGGAPPVAPRRISASFATVGAVPQGAPARPAPASAPPPPVAPAKGGLFGRLFGGGGPSASAPPPAAPMPASQPVYSPVEMDDSARAEEDTDGALYSSELSSAFDDDLYGFSTPEEALDQAKPSKKASAPVRGDSLLDDEGPVRRLAEAMGPVALLGRQLASGLWAGEGAGSEPVRQARGTALALLELLRHGITSSHALHGAQVKKAVDALLALASGLKDASEVAELALGVAWLAASGPRTRQRIVQAAQGHAGLTPRLGDEAALRQHVDALAGR